MLRVEKLDADSGSQVEFTDVLLVKTETQTLIGQPLVEGAMVKGVIEGAGKADKVLVFKYKKKKQYRRTRGHRQQFSYGSNRKHFSGRGSVRDHRLTPEELWLTKRELEVRGTDATASPNGWASSASPVRM